MTTNRSKKPSNIQLPPLPYNEELHHKTMEYWKLSLIWNNRLKSRMTVQDAINISADALMGVNPARPLFPQMLNLSSNIVRYGSKSNMLKDLPQLINESSNDNKIVVL